MMKMTEALAVPCLLALIPSAGFAQIARVSVPVTPLSVVAGALASSPLPAPGASLSAAPILSLVMPVMPAPSVAPVPAALAPAPVAAAKLALTGLKSGAARFAQADRTGASATAGLAISASLFDAAAKSGDEQAPPVDARVAGLNAAVGEILQPFNNQLTKASFSFSRLETNAERATRAELSVSFDKQGPDGKAALKIDNLSYSYPEEAGALPRTEGRVKLDFNLRNQLTQQQINQFGSAADKLVAGFLADYAKKYGAAAVLDARVTGKQTDAQGNLVGLGLTLAVKFDFSKLPAGVDQKTIAINEGRIDVAVTLDGLEAAFTVVSNPNSSSFAKDQTGLKEVVEKLLAREPRTLRQISDAVKSLDQLAGYLTTRHAPAAASLSARGAQKPLVDQLKEVPGVKYAQLGGYRGLIIAVDGSKPLAEVEAAVMAKFPDLAQIFDTLFYVDAKNPMEQLAKVDLKGTRR